MEQLFLQTQESELAREFAWLSIYLRTASSNEWRGLLFPVRLYFSSMHYNVQQNKTNTINYIIVLCFSADYSLYLWTMVSEFALPQRTCYNVYSTTKKILGIKAYDIDMIVLVGELCFIVMYYSLHSGTVIIKITIKEGVRR